MSVPFTAAEKILGGHCGRHVQAGDFIWMAPYCPQWFCAVGKQPAKYLIYKNFNRHTIAKAK